MSEPSDIAIEAARQVGMAKDWVLDARIIANEIQCAIDTSTADLQHKLDVALRDAEDHRLIAEKTIKQLERLREERDTTSLLEPSPAEVVEQLRKNNAMLENGLQDACAILLDAIREKKVLKDRVLQLE